MMVLTHDIVITLNIFANSGEFDSEDQHTKS